MSIELEKIILVILTILSIIGVGFITASLSFFLQWLYRWNFIGIRYITYLRWLRKKFKSKKAKKRWDNISMPLGMCVYCQSTWISIFTCILFGLNPIYIIFCIGTNYFFIEKIDKIVNPRFY